MLRRLVSLLFLPAFILLIFPAEKEALPATADAVKTATVISGTLSARSEAKSHFSSLLYLLQPEAVVFQAGIFHFSNPESTGLLLLIFLLFCRLLKTAQLIFPVHSVHVRNLFYTLILINAP
ncbi:hypothetical protein Q0590_17580 [Rhodocytophaga aerolata]|uniref:Uncharacterized protein n=1 Tax=Rhodocytophaga aerolata TaxID=455078 RepID=A0ABT8R9R4_9BACT|nr:hypothetical protein [Rhodocytophaga aerolata]MDO1448089.1 hypothetical protein [Rhodocytophaga aerolata]